MKNKYEFTDEIIEHNNSILHRIKALKDFGEAPYEVHKGDLGGFIEKEDNLSQDGDCWVYYNAKVCNDAIVFDDAIIYNGAQVYDNANVFGFAKVYGNAQVYDNTQIFGNTEICGNAEVSDIGDYMVFRNSWSSGRYFTWTKSNDMWRVGCFYGTGEELIKKAYIDSKLSGKMYEKYVNFVKELNTNV